MTKEELQESISEAIRTEESASALYLKHLDAIVTRSGLPDNTVNEARQIVFALINANKRHKALLEDLRERVRGEKIDVY
ncbi:MAG: hypothetical protein R6V03_02045 [Kiritimatiellia bacterium]